MEQYEYGIQPLTGNPWLVHNSVSRFLGCDIFFVGVQFVIGFQKLFYCYIFEFVHLLQINESLRPRIICGSSSGLRTRWIMGLKEFGLLDTWRAHEGEFYTYFLLRFSLQFNYLVWITCW